MKRRLTSLILAFALAGGGALMASSSAQADDPPTSELTSAGQEFWLAFDINLNEDSQYLRLYISGATGTKGNVAIAGISFSADFTIGQEGVASVDVPLSARGAVDYSNAVSSTPGKIAPLAIHVTADHDVTVYGLNRAKETTDAYLGLPVTALGQRYRLVDYEPFIGSKYDMASLSYGSFLSAVATQDNTTVSVTPDSRSSQKPFTVALSSGQVFEWESLDASLTGSVVTSDKPVSVFSGNRCTRVPLAYAACDHLVEQMMPTTTWGKTFVTYPLYGRTQDTFRIVADVDGTQITVNKKSGTVNHSLSAGEFWEFMSGEPMAVTSNQPIEVAQYSNSENFDNTVSDPFMVLVPPYEQGFTDSVFATPTSGFTNYVNITAPTANIADVKLDGKAIPNDQWQAIPGSDYSGMSAPISAGNHSISSPAPLQTIVYGFADYDSYGYPGGLRTARIAEANTITLESKATGLTGSQLCVKAALVDSGGKGIPGARLDVTMPGIVKQSFSVVTGADGSVPICATSTVDGSTTVTVTQGSLTAESFMDWSHYTVTYDANKGTGTVTDEKAYFLGEEATAATNAFSRVGFTFSSWNTAVDGSGQTFLPGEPVTMSGNITLYAQWKAPVIQAQTGGAARTGNGSLIVLAGIFILAGLVVQRVGTQCQAKQR